jgi:phosphoribosylformimino-5-aminoimidazole carboxamide ribonucleotide (ProFAR) isomerase
MGFIPCIDLRNGKVVQIVGGSLNEEERGILSIDWIHLNNSTLKKIYVTGVGYEDNSNDP